MCFFFFISNSSSCHYCWVFPVLSNCPIVLSVLSKPGLVSKVLRTGEWTLLSNSSDDPHFGSVPLCVWGLGVFKFWVRNSPWMFKLMFLLFLAECSFLLGTTYYRGVPACCVNLSNSSRLVSGFAVVRTFALVETWALCLFAPGNQAWLSCHPGAPLSPWPSSLRPIGFSLSRIW